MINAKQMNKSNTFIPINTSTGDNTEGIAICRITVDVEQVFTEVDHSHRDEYHLFMVQEEGNSQLEIDFEHYELNAGSIIGIHPNQVHRIGPFSKGRICFFLINNENLNSDNLTLLDDITPLKPLTLNDRSYQLIADVISLCIKLSDDVERKLNRVLIKDSCNLLVRLIISQYLTDVPPSDKLSRFELVTKAFKTSLDFNFVTAKRPAEYAEKLNLSKSYLYECVKKTTGFSVSYHIEQRIILEAKRLLYYSDRSVKEIAAELGFDDYPYFTRLFAKATGMTAITFRKKKRE